MVLGVEYFCSMAIGNGFFGSDVFALVVNKNCLHS